MSSVRCKECRQFFLPSKTLNWKCCNEAVISPNVNFSKLLLKKVLKSLLLIGSSEVMSNVIKHLKGSSSFLKCKDKSNVRNSFKYSMNGLIAIVDEGWRLGWTYIILQISARVYFTYWMLTSAVFNLLSIGKFSSFSWYAASTDWLIELANSLNCLLPWCSNSGT